MIRLYEEVGDDIGSIPFVLDVGNGLTYWCSSPQVCLQSYLNEGINKHSTRPEAVGAVLIGEYESIEVMKLEWLLDE